MTGSGDSARYIFEVYFDPALLGNALQGAVPVVDPLSGITLQNAVQLVGEIQYTQLQPPLLGGDAVPSQQFSRSYAWQVEQNLAA